MNRAPYGSDRMTICPVCLDPRQADHHCPGPRQRIREEPPEETCDCNSGGWHEPDCPKVTG